MHKILSPAAVTILLVFGAMSLAYATGGKIDYQELAAGAAGGYYGYLRGKSDGNSEE